MEPSEEEKPIFLDRVSRITRGKRMSKLLDEEIEEDEMFWNQDALKEEENDENYEEEAEVADVFDSDFDEDEPEQDEGVEDDADERKQTKKRLIFPGKKLTNKTKKKKVLPKVEGRPIDEKSSQQSSLPESSPPENHDIQDDLEAEKIVRKSTRTSVIVRQAERDAIRAALQATMKPIKRKKEGEEKRMTQEEMLLEAAQTEIMNLRNLERVLAKEEEVKERATVHKEVYDGPQIRYCSKNGCSYLEFSNGASFQSEIPTSVPYPEKSLCAITGLPAKYRDPKTGFPYATKEAFRILRDRFSDEKSRDGKETDLGLLGSICGRGFSVTRKRSEISNRSENSYFRYLARFRQIPALESQVSE